MTDTTDTIDTAEDGNRSLRCRYVSFTWHDYESSVLAQLDEYMAKECTRATYQEEYTKDMKPHLQGAMEFKNARYFNSIHKKFPGIWLSKTRNREDALGYGCKDESKIPDGHRFIHNFIPKVKLKNPMEGKILREWQVEINTIIAGEPDERTIYWYYDETGNTGKTTWCKGLCIERPGEILYLSGKGSDMKYGVKSFIDNKENRLKVCLFDYTRTVENYISYEGIESIKNGIFYNSKYESGMVLFNPVHVVIFANFLPDETALSKDRWIIREITEDGSVKTPEKRIIKLGKKSYEEK